MSNVRTPDQSPLSWMGGYTVQHLITLTDYEQLPAQERRALIERIETKQDQYQRWLQRLQHSPKRSEEIEQIKTTLVALKAKKLEIYTSLRPEFKGLVNRATQPPTQHAA